MTDIAGRSPVPRRRRFRRGCRALARVGSGADGAAGRPDPAGGAGARTRRLVARRASAPVRSTPLASGVISFVPGVSDADRLDQPAPAPAPGLPTVEVSDAPPPVSGAPAADRGPVSGAGVVIESIDETRISTGERPFARLVWDDGTRQALYGRTLFGRNPTETGAMVSPVRDETLSLSKTHFELIPDDDRAVWVVDGTPPTVSRCAAATTCLRWSQGAHGSGRVTCSCSATGR
jgi:hypothetical protein